MMAPYTNPPPAIDMTDATGWMTWACASTMGRANPVTTMIEVMNLPKSIMGDELSYSAEKSDERTPAAASAFGKGAEKNISAGPR